MAMGKRTSILSDEWALKGRKRTRDNKKAKKIMLDFENILSSMDNPQLLYHPHLNPPKADKSSPVEGEEIVLIRCLAY